MLTIQIMVAYIPVLISLMRSFSALANFSFLADRTNGRAIRTVLRLSVCRLSVCL